MNRLNRVQDQGNNHNDQRDLLVISHDPIPPFSIDGSNVGGTKSQAPSVSYLPETRRFRIHLSIFSKIGQLSDDELAKFAYAQVARLGSFFVLNIYWKYGRIKMWLFMAETMRGDDLYVPNCCEYSRESTVRYADG